jgi:hypothetical protein
MVAHRGRGLGLPEAKVPEVGFIPRFQPIPNRLSQISREARGAHGGFANVEEKALTSLARTTVGQGRGSVTTQRLPDRARLSGVRGVHYWAARRGARWAGSGIGPAHAGKFSFFFFCFISCFSLFIIILNPNLDLNMSFTFESVIQIQLKYV